ncbi:MAG: sulfotransferase family protein [Pyrinomonadaceae bacterium]
MPVCIAGMHRSGTSMVTNLLSLCGIYLGDEGDLMPPSPDNENGYWEHLRFVRINDLVLRHFGGAWDDPPRAIHVGWREKIRLVPLMSEAKTLLREFAGREPWGWKDPRNSLTLPFWTSLVPELKVVWCLRNPFEVEQSLRERTHGPHPWGLDLWWLYNRKVLDSTGPAAGRVVTHYEAYFQNPRRELRRVLACLNLRAAEDDLERCASVVSQRLRHSRFGTEQLARGKAAPEIFELYAELCEAAGFTDPSLPARRRRPARGWVYR